MSTITLQPRLGRPLAAVAIRAPRSAALRLTSRGRLVVVAMALLVAFVVGVFVAAAGSVATERPGSPAPTRIMQVHSGDTLWDIASSLGGDVRSTMAAIERLNAMSGADIRVGQRLVVPAG